jgi:hypothetical protein
MSTFATLLVLPSVFAVLIGRRAYGSPSIYPDDRKSVYFDPSVFAHEDHKEDLAEGGEAGAYDVVAQHTDDEILGFLRSMLHEIRSKRHEMVTHHSPDDLLDTLGFANTGKSDGKSQAPDGGPGAVFHPERPPHSPPLNGGF